MNQSIRAAITTARGYLRRRHGALIRSTLGAVAAAVLGSAPAQSRGLSDSVEHIRDQALKDDTALRVIESLTTKVGARPVGTRAMERARDWASAELAKMGFTNIKVETFTAPTWTRTGIDRAEIVGSYPRSLQILAIGGSASTPAGGLTAPIALFPTYQDLLDQPAGSLSGKIAVVTQRMAPTPDLSGYIAMLPARASGAVEAAKRGAVGYLLRSMSTADTRLPHTGNAKAGGIPAAALSPPDAELLERIVSNGESVTIRLDVTSVSNAASVGYNVSGDIPGRTNKIVIVGGHLDSWDPGTGAVDDGAGIGISLAAAKLAASLDGQPRRTIRVVMWGDEEQQGASAPYAAAHQAEIDRIVVAAESDTGTDRVFAVALPRGSLDHPDMRIFRNAMAPLGVVTLSTPAREGGANVQGIQAAGAPVFEVSQDLTRYMQIHHSADDTFDKIDPQQLAQNVAVWAAFVHTVAYSDINFRELAAKKP